MSMSDSSGGAVGKGRMPTSLFVFAAVVVGCGLGMFGLNYWHATRCAEAHSAEALKGFLDGVTRRMLTAESQTVRNSLFMDKVLNSLERQLIAIEDREFAALSAKSQDEAVRVVMQLAAHPNQVRAEFPLDPKYLDAEVLADTIDAVLKTAGEVGDDDDKKDDFLMLGGGSGGSQGGGGGGIDKDSTPSDGEVLKSCQDWKEKYSVVQGVSWGHLPFDLQGKWMKLKCDIFLANTVPL